MSRLPRPYVPLSVRVQVAEAMLPIEVLTAHNLGGLRARLEFALAWAFPDTDIHLDHDPPLGAREKIMRDGEIVGYKPDANDPRFLIYRTKVDHKLKTNVRGEHGQHPDRVLIKKQRRRERPPSKRRKVKIQNRGFSKGQKRAWPKRPFR